MLTISPQQIKKANEEFKKAQSILQKPVKSPPKDRPTRRKRNPSIYIFRNIETQQQFVGSIYDLCRIHDLSRSNLTMLVRGRYKRVGVWQYVGMAEDQPEEVKTWQPYAFNKRCPIKHRFKHEDGRVVVATQYDFGRDYNLNAGNLSSVVKGRRKTVKGWSYDGVYRSQ